LPDHHHSAKGGQSLAFHSPTFKRKQDAHGGQQMKILPIVLLLFLPACSTIKQAKTDWRNFNRTISLNINQPAVYKNAQF
jgi:hypothetical protein